MHLYCIRHTSIIDGWQGICYGQTDMPADHNRFEAEYQQLASYLPQHFDLVLCSPLLRCLPLCERLSAEQKLIIPALKELHFGQWEGKAWNSIAEEELQQWMSDYLNHSPPDGESYRQLFDRLQTVVDYSLTLKAQSMAWVTHAGCLRALLHILLGIPAELSFFFRLTTPALAIFEYEAPHWYLASWNPPMHTRKTSLQIPRL